MKFQELVLRLLARILYMLVIPQTGIVDPTNVVEANKLSDEVDRWIGSHDEQPALHQRVAKFDYVSRWGLCGI